MAYKETDVRQMADGGGSAETMWQSYGNARGIGDRKDAVGTKDCRFFENFEREPVYIIGSDGTITPSEHIKLPDSANGRTKPGDMSPFPENPGRIPIKDGLLGSGKLTPEQIAEAMEQSGKGHGFIGTKESRADAHYDSEKAAREKEKNEIRGEYLSDMTDWAGRHPDSPLSFNDWLDSKVKDVVSPGFPSGMTSEEYAEYRMREQEWIDENGYPFGMTRGDMDAWHGYSDDWASSHPDEPAPGIEEFLQWREDNVLGPDIGLDDPKGKPGLQLPPEVLEALNKAAEEAGMEEPYSITVTRENCPELFDKIQEMIDEQQGIGLSYLGGSMYFDESMGRYEQPDDGPKGFLEHEAALNENPVLADGQLESTGAGEARDVARDAMEKLFEQARSVSDQAKDILGGNTPVLGDPEELARRQEQQRAFFEAFNRQLEEIDLDAAFENMKHPDVGLTLMGAVSDEYEPCVEDAMDVAAIDDPTVPGMRAEEAERLADFENDGLESGSDDYGLEL